MIYALLPIIEKWRQFLDEGAYSNGLLIILRKQTQKNQEIQINIGEIAIFNSKCKKLPGIHFDKHHVRSLCKKASQKLNAFARIAYSLKSEQRKLLLNAFMTSQLSYTPVVWMFHNRKLNNHINLIRERALRITYQDHNSRFNELLAKDGSFEIHDRNLQKLVIEIFKLKMKLPPEIMNEVFDFIECQYPFRNELRFKSRNIRTESYGIETAAFVGSKIWTNMPKELKENTLRNEFKSKIKTWKPENCPCKLCKIYIQRICNLQVTDWHMFTHVTIYVSFFFVFFFPFFFLFI